MKTRRQKNRGFTLLELLIVVAIIGIIAAVAIPTYRDYTRKAMILEAVMIVNAMKTEFYNEWLQTGRFPNRHGGLKTDYDLSYITSLNYDYEGSQTGDGKVWFAARMSSNFFDTEADDAYKFQIHLGGKVVDGDFVFMCGTWDRTTHGEGIDPAWLPPGCNKTNVLEKLDAL